MEGKGSEEVMILQVELYSNYRFLHTNIFTFHDPRIVAVVDRSIRSLTRGSLTHTPLSSLYRVHTFLQQQTLIEFSSQKHPQFGSWLNSATRTVAQTYPKKATN